MIEETATVVDIEEGFAWVQTQRRSACDACSANSACGSGVLSRVLGRREHAVRALNEVGARAGEAVIIGLEEQAFVRGSLAVYGVPLLSLLGGGLLGESLAPSLMLTSEGLSIAGGLLGLFAGLWWVRRFSRRIQADARYQPIVLRRLPATTVTHSVSMPSISH